MRLQVAPLGALLAIWLLLTGSLFVGPGRLYLIDTALIDVPFRVHAARMIREGHFPFWTSMVECGFPQFSDGQTGILYPFFLLYLFSPSPAANDAFMAIHFLIAGLAMYAYLAQRRLLPWAALLGASAFMGGPTLQACHVIPGLVSTLCWLPLALFFLDRYERGLPRSLWWCGLVNVLILLAGCPNSALICFLIEIPYLAKVLWRGRLTAEITAPFVVFALPIVIAAVQLLPTYEYLRDSHRGEHLPWEAIVFNTVYRLQDIVMMGVSRAVDLPVSWFGYALVAPLAAVALWRHPRRTHLWFWFLVGMFGLLVAMGTPLLPMLYWLPVIDWFRWPMLYVIFTYVALNILIAEGAGVAFVRLRHFLSGYSPRVSHGVMASIAVLLAVLAISGSPIATLEAQGDFYALASPDILKASRQSGHFRLLPLLHGAVEGREPDKPQQFWSQQRMRDSALTLAPDYNLIHSVPVAILKNQVDAVTPRELTELVTSSVPIPWGLIRVAAVTHISEVDPLPSQLEAETELISTDPVLLYRVKNPLPRAWMVYDLARIDDRRQRLARINDPSFDPRRLAVVETEINISPPPPTSDDAIDNYVNFSEPSPGSLRMEVETAREGLLVIADRYAPEIAATLDGQPVPLYRVNHAFRGVVVPPGKHLVEMRYVPTAFYQGLAISAIGLGVFVIGCACAGRRERKPIAEPIDPSPPPSIAPQIVTNR
jgi:hypothetical protein